MTIHEYIVIGSGCSGAMVAQTLIEKGAKVMLLDAGKEKSEAHVIPDVDFTSLRKTDKQQFRYLIGENAEGVVWGKVGKGEQVTPPRRHMLQSVESHIPVDSENFSSLESLGYGGLGIGWGLQCWEYSVKDMKSAGLNPESMSKAYETVGSRIGISATKDDAAAYTIGSLKTYDDSPEMDRNHKYLYKKYLEERAYFNDRGYHMGRTPLALITQDRPGRKKYAYRDMDFYSDNDKSAWRPWITVDVLKKNPGFSYVGGYLVVLFREKKDYVEIVCVGMEDNKKRIFYCRRLVLAASALGSGRLVLRSLGTNDSLPILCNPYSYVPTVQPRFVGKEIESRKLGFTQLSMFLDKNNDNSNVSVASLYSYQSLMLFRLIRHLPLNFVDARVIMRYLMTGLVIMGIHHPDSVSLHKRISLVANTSTPTSDQLHIDYALTDTELRENKRRTSDFIKSMRKLGAYSKGSIDPGNGASIHYAGTVPFSDSDKPFTLTPTGRLRGTKSIYVADSSGFRYLPAPGLTFSLMANAHLTAEAAFNHA